MEEDGREENKEKVERILCCNVLSSGDRKEARFFRQPFFSYDEEITWPPDGWEELSCWYCGYGWPTIDGKLPDKWIPCTIPINYESSTDTWIVHGFYCSWNCAKRELISNQGFGCGERPQLIEFLARKLGYTGEDEIIPAQHFSILEKYSGKTHGISIEEYRRQNVFSYSTDCKPPFITQPRCYERHEISGDSSGWSAQGLRINEGDKVKKTHTEASANNMYTRFMNSKRNEQSTSSEKNEKQGSTNYAGTLLDYQSKRK